ncbi:MAG: Fic family protein [Proteobacteria bacterium]|nr:Fic family protein [Pseudomonadota bacterium]
MKITEQIKITNKEIAELVSTNPYLNGKCEYLSYIKLNIPKESQILYPDFPKDHPLYEPISNINMRNQQTAFDYVTDNVKNTIVPESIKTIHQIVCAKDRDDGGQFRTQSKWMDINITPPDWRKIPDKFKVLCNELELSSPMKAAFELHYRIIKLQPFDNYNKRVARLVMNWMLLQNGYTPIVLNHKADKKEYIDALDKKATDIDFYNNFFYEKMFRTQGEIVHLLKQYRRK